MKLLYEHDLSKIMGVLSMEKIGDDVPTYARSHPTAPLQNMMLKHYYHLVVNTYAT